MPGLDAFPVETLDGGFAKIVVADGGYEANLATCASGGNEELASAFPLLIHRIYREYYITRR